MRTSSIIFAVPRLRVLSSFRRHLSFCFVNNAKLSYPVRFSTTFFSSTSTAIISSFAETNKFNTNVFNLIKRYEDIIGLTDVKNAQKLVLQGERDFTKMQELRREKQDEIRDVQTRLKEIHMELDKTSRGEDRYLNLLTQEHSIIKREKQLLDEFKQLERSERDCFSVLSTRLRESHEKERERAERTKYWSIIGSLIGGAIGIIGTTINNKLRMRDLREIVQETSEPGKFQTVIAQLTAMVQQQQQQIALFVKDLNNMLSNKGQSNGSMITPVIALKESKEMLPPQGEVILSALKQQDERLELEMKEIKQMIAVEHGYSMGGDGTVVYIGPQMEKLLDQTEKNLEWKIKINTLVNVVVLYGTLAITIPILYAIFRGG